MDISIKQKLSTLFVCMLAEEMAFSTSC